MAGVPSSIKVIALAGCMAAAAVAGPVDFGLAELRAAMEQRKFTPAQSRVTTELSMVLPPEGFHIQSRIIRGGSPRGLMYGLLEAASQIRTRGRLAAVRAEPQVSIRGVRRAATEEDWNRGEEEWLDYFSDMARRRFNRFHLTVGGELTREHVEALQRISRAAMERAIDITLGVEQPRPAVLREVLNSCPAVRSVHADTESAALLSGVVSEAGRYMVLETSEPVQPAVPVPRRVGVSHEAGAEKPCEGSCVFYWLFPAGSDPPASLGDAAGFEVEGEPGDAWRSYGYPAPRPAPAPAKKAAPRRPAAKKK